MTGFNSERVLERADKLDRLLEASKLPSRSEFEEGLRSILSMAPITRFTKEALVTQGDFHFKTHKNLRALSRNPRRKPDVTVREILGIDEDKEYYAGFDPRTSSEFDVKTYLACEQFGGNGVMRGSGFNMGAWASELKARYGPGFVREIVQREGYEISELL